MVADPLHPEYRIQPGIVDFDHLELVALVKVARSSWMPHFRLIAPSLQSGVYIPQQRYKRGAGSGHPENQGSVRFVRDDGSYLPAAVALEGHCVGLVNRNCPVLEEAGFTVTLRFEVNRPYHPR